MTGATVHQHIGAALYETHIAGQEDSVCVLRQQQDRYIRRRSDYIIGFITPAIGPNKSKKLTRPIVQTHNLRGKVWMEDSAHGFNLLSVKPCMLFFIQTLPRILCTSAISRVRFLEFVWTDCWGDKSNYVITSPANCENEKFCTCTFWTNLLLYLRNLGFLTQIYTQKEYIRAFLSHFYTCCMDCKNFHFYKWQLSLESQHILAFHTQLKRIWGVHLRPLHA